MANRCGRNRVPRSARGRINKHHRRMTAAQKRLQWLDRLRPQPVRAGPSMQQAHAGHELSVFIPKQLPANGVPWLLWSGRRGWRCEICGRAGELPPFSTVAGFAKALGDLKREHHPCGAGVEEPEVRGIGHPLNPDRVDR